MKQTLLFMVILFALSPGISREKTKPSESGYTPVNGLNLYYEVYGKGNPVVLLQEAAS
jgi:hypothetical protein